MASWPVFWCDYTGLADIVLRRHTIGAERTCPVYGTFHGRPSGVVDRRDYTLGDDGFYPLIPPEEYEGNEWWPRFCDCGYEFSDDDRWQVMGLRLYRARDGRPGEWHDRRMPIGAVWDIEWNHIESWSGWDGKAISVRVPGGGDGHDWWPDSRANNCGRACPWFDDERREQNPDHARAHSELCDPHFMHHKCWVRVGDPVTGDPPLHVSKDGSELPPGTPDRFRATCAAGAGSIAAPGWHGFLHRGVLA